MTTAVNGLARRIEPKKNRVTKCKDTGFGNMIRVAKEVEYKRRANPLNMPSEHLTAAFQAREKLRKILEGISTTSLDAQITSQVRGCSFQASSSAISLPKLTESFQI